MVDDSGLEPRNKPESKEILPPEAVGHYMHWAHVFMEGYFKDKLGKDIRQPRDSIKPKPEQVSKGMHDTYKYLEEFDGKIASLMTVTDPLERQTEYGKYVTGYETKIFDTMSCALLFTHVLLELERNIPEGKETSDSAKAEEKEFNKANLRKLQHGLNASLFSLGYASGTAKPTGLPRTQGYRPSGDRGTTSLISLFRKGLYDTLLSAGIVDKIASTDFQAHFIKTQDLLHKVYFGGFYAGQSQAAAAQSR